MEATQVTIKEWKDKQKVLYMWILTHTARTDKPWRHYAKWISQPQKQQYDPIYTTKHEMVGWHHLTQWTWVWVNSRSWWCSLACCSPCGSKELDTTEQLNWYKAPRVVKFIKTGRKWSPGLGEVGNRVLV